MKKRLAVFKAIFVWILAAFWWNCLLSVYKIKLDSTQLFFWLFIFTLLCALICAGSKKKFLIPTVLLAVLGVIVMNRVIVAAALNRFANAWMKVQWGNASGILLYNDSAITASQMALAAAIVTIPILFLWMAVILSGKGKTLAAVIICVPIILTAVQQYLPSGKSIWFILFGACIYFAVIPGNSGVAILRSGLIAAFIFVIMIGISMNVGTKLDKSKGEQDGNYYKIRTAVKDNIVKKVTEIEIEEKEEEKSAKERAEQDKEQSDAPVEAQSKEEPVLPEVGHGFTAGNKLTELDSVARFNPQNNAVAGLRIQVSQKPIDTFYYGESYGGSYWNNEWTDVQEGEAFLEEYMQFPESLTRLKLLCYERRASSLEETESFIRKEFTENTVYDFYPGRVPEGKDFAEYFLFDNKKGFCVHFATTATLMYRICGYPARYVEGYAIPASAFEEQKDGTYIAQATGDMGHAWCEVYQDRWLRKEHTLSYEGGDISQQQPAAYVEENSNMYAGVLRTLLSIMVALLLMVGLIVLQYHIRKQAKYRRFRQGKCMGFQQIYQNIYEIGLFQGIAKAEPLSSESFRALAEKYQEIPKEEWDWVKASVLSSLFYTKAPTKTDCVRLMQIYRSICKKAKEETNIGGKIRFRYFLCLD